MNPGLRRGLRGLGPPGPPGEPETTLGIDLFRWVLVASLAGTVWMTWPLWQIRESPPLLPVGLPLPQLDLGYPLLLALLAVLVYPFWGIAAFTLLAAYAMLLDQTRLQPQVFSMIILLWACLPWPRAQTFARAHLITMWFWAGAHKLVSSGYYLYFPPFVANAIFGEGVVPKEWLAPMGFAIALSEAGLALLLLVPRLRKPAVLMALGIHVMILFSLLSAGWNSSVWAWNVAVPSAAFALFWTLDTSPRQVFRVQPRWLQALIVLQLVSPLGYYTGRVDAHVAYCLYSYNKATAHIAGSDGRYERIDPRPVLNAPIPPEHRLFEQYFRLSGRPGDVLAIRDPRIGAGFRGVDRRLLQLGEHGELIDRSDELAADPDD